MKHYLILIAALLFLSGFSFSQEISEDAMDKYRKGSTALELGTTKSDLETAAAAFEEAAVLEPNWPDPHYQLGVVYDRLEKYELSLNHLTTYLSIAKSDDQFIKAAEDLKYRVEFKLNKLTKKADREILLADGKWDRGKAPYRNVSPFEITKDGNSWWVEVKCPNYAEYPYLFYQRVQMTVSEDGFSFSFENSRCPLAGELDYCVEIVKVNAKLISEDPLIYQVTETETKQKNGSTANYSYEWKFYK